MATREKIRMIRRLKDFSQDYVAHRLNMTQKSYSKFERGGSKPIPQKRLGKIAEIFEMPVQEILDFEPEKPIEMEPLEDKMSRMEIMLEKILDFLGRRPEEREREKNRDLR